MPDQNHQTTPPDQGAKPTHATRTPPDKYNLAYNTVFVIVAIFSTTPPSEEATFQESMYSCFALPEQRKEPWVLGIGVPASACSFSRRACRKSGGRFWLGTAGTGDKHSLVHKRLSFFLKKYLSGIPGLDWTGPRSPSRHGDAE